MVSHDYGLFRNAAGAFRVHRELGIPWVSEIHHVDGYPRRSSLRGALRRALTRRHVRKSQSKVSAFRVVSKQIADLLITWGVPSARIQVLGSLYLDLHELWPSTSKRDVDVLFCGRLEPEKGLGLLVDSLSYLQERRPGLKVVVLGLSASPRWRLRSR